MGPLLYEFLENEVSELKKHVLALLIIVERPTGWKEKIQNYIANISKNSFYLLNVYNTLSNEYNFGFSSRQTINEIEFLIKMCFAKHEFGDAKPGLDKIKKVRVERLSKAQPDDEDIEF
jgi:hypothetical protein